MKITFLGTGTSQGVPVVGCQCEVCLSNNPKDKRFRSSIFIETNDQRAILVDTSPDLRQQMLDNGISNIDFILYTHEHSDHTAGIDDVRPINFKHRKNIPVYGLSRVMNDLKDRFKYIFVNEYHPGLPKMTAHNIDDLNINEKINITPIPLHHGKLEILGYRFGSFAYLTDVKSIPDSSKELLKDLDLMVINALHHGNHPTHMNLDEALMTVKELNPTKCLLTHLSHKMGKHDQISENLPENVGFAYDGMSVRLK